MPKLISDRRTTSEAFAKGNFIRKVLREEGQNIKKSQEKNMLSFSSDTISGRRFSVKDTELVYTHKAVHRLIDIRTRNTPNGKIKKKHYVIHNKPIYGVVNNIVRRIQFGFTDAIREEMSQLDSMEI